MSCNIPMCVQSSPVQGENNAEIDHLPQKEISKHHDSPYTYMKGDSPSPLQGDSKLSDECMEGDSP